MRADADLPWYFGSGASTAQGDMGLRSPLGAQLEVLASGVLQTERTVDASQAEETMLDRVGVGARLRRIEAALAKVEQHHVAALRLHYSTASWPYGVSAAASLLPWSEAMTGPGGLYPQDLRGALHGAPEKVRQAVRQWADDLVAEAQAAYERAAKGAR